ncbi:MAG: sensor histidine kinase [Actinomycetota bacterium]|nr:sensor histidine kinase [Actinomycetota bacterium]
MALAFTLANLWLVALNARTPNPGGPASGWMEAVTGLAYAALAAVGMVVVTRRSDNGAGWVFLAAGTVLAFGAFASEYGSYGVLTEPGSLPAMRYVTWAGAWGWWAAAAFALAFGLMLYPDGTLPSPRWRPAAVAAAAMVGALALVQALAPGPLDGEYSPVVNPVGLEGARFLRRLRDGSWVALGANAALAATAVLSKVRRASGDGRRQLLWVLVPAAVAVVAAPVWGMTQRADRPSPVARALVVVVAFGTPLAVAAALAHAATLRRSVERLVLAREEERRRIRRDLHDGLGPTLAGVALQLDVARDMVGHDPDAARRVLDGVIELVNRGIADIRRLVDDLRPPVLDQLGLVAAIHEGASYLNGRGDRGELTVVVETAGNVGALPPATEVTAFRIIMEAVNNACRHSRASRCVVRLAVDRAVDLQVEDDGCGLATDHPTGTGLGSMQERAAELGGSCVVERGTAGGTIVRVRLPLPVA